MSLRQPPPTNQPDQPTASPLIHYYAMRVTVPHADRDALMTILDTYSKNYLIGTHGAHPEEGDLAPAEHFHCVFPDIDKKTVEAMRKTLKKWSGRGGNGFYSGKFMDNTVYKAIQYIRHDDSAKFFFRGDWEKIIDDSPEWDPEPSAKRQKIRERSERPSFPTLTYSNVIKQALKFRERHALTTVKLGEVCEKMQSMEDWQPDIRIMRTGLDPMHFQIFEYHASNKFGKGPAWWLPRADYDDLPGIHQKNGNGRQVYKCS